MAVFISLYLSIILSYIKWFINLLINIIDIYLQYKSLCYQYIKVVYNKVHILFMDLWNWNLRNAFPFWKATFWFMGYTKNCSIIFTIAPVHHLKSWICALTSTSNDNFVKLVISFHCFSVFFKRLQRESCQYFSYSL